MAKSGGETVRVQIQATGSWSWFTQVDMPRAEYEEYVARMDSDDRRERRRADSDVVGLYLHMRDIEIDDHQIDLEEFALVGDTATLGGSR